MGIGRGRDDYFISLIMEIRVIGFGAYLVKSFADMDESNFGCGVVILAMLFA